MIVYPAMHSMDVSTEHGHSFSSFISTMITIHLRHMAIPIGITHCHKGACEPATTCARRAVRSWFGEQHHVPDGLQACTTVSLLRDDQTLDYKLQTKL
jgi:hypothetical protein